MALVASFTLTSCNDYENTYSYAPRVKFSLASTTVDENGGPFQFSVQLVGPQQSSDITVGVQVTESGAVAGTDYSLGFDNVVIPANTSSVNVSVNIIDNTGFSADARSLQLDIVSVNGAGAVTAPLEGEDGKSLTINIKEDDCPVPTLAGTWIATTTPAPGAASNCDGSPYEYEVVITEVSAGVYDISDITLGLYVTCYAAADNPAQIIQDGFNISFADQPDVVYGGDVFGGSGGISCEGVMTLEFSNGFGDAGSASLVRK